MRAVPVSLVGVYLLEGCVDALAACRESPFFDLHAVVVRRGDPSACSLAKRWTTTTARLKSI